MFKDKPTTTDGQADDAKRTQPAYKLRQKLREMDLTLKYPHLSPKERRRARGETDPRNVSGEKVKRGRIR